MPHPRPITYQHCDVCEKLRRKGIPEPIKDSYLPRKSVENSNHAPVHSWYNFTLGYSPQFVDYIITSKGITAEDYVLDPFMGAGTTVVECKLQGIDSYGIDANDFMVFAAGIKTKWDIDPIECAEAVNDVLDEITRETSTIRGTTESKPLSDFFSSNHLPSKDLDSLQLSPLIEKYISPVPAKKLLIIKEIVSSLENRDVKNLLKLALAAIAVPSSNLRYGPGPGLIKPKKDVDVLGLFRKKTQTIIKDLNYLKELNSNAKSGVFLGDCRDLSEVLKGKMFDHVITSPPYVGDHEYTRHTRLELVLLDFTLSMEEIRTVKKRMIRGSTRNVYKNDNEVEYVSKFDEVVEMMDLVQKRVKETKGTSGFEKMYHRVVGEYFGGMYLSMQQLYDHLEDRGTVALLVGDSHGFKMVHSETARILGTIAEDIGFKVKEIKCWRHKKSTAHEFYLPENILNLAK
ncbi:MAG: DNA methyltransferase [Candidatus Odinarchaeota archaeon]